MLHFYILIPQHFLATTHVMTHIQQLKPINKPHIHHYALGHLKFLEFYLGYYHITGQTSKKCTGLVQPGLHMGVEGRCKSQLTNNNNNTHQLSSPSLVSSWQTKNKIDHTKQAGIYLC